tara:strand:+ start:357164 stop:357979 length:816 start_codon:yes stop_codon:yes gene_type:complete
MKKQYFLLVFFWGICFANSQTAGVDVFINEIHYDNAGTDANEGVEIAGPEGTDLSAFTLTAYNGNNNEAYHTVTLSGTIPDEDDTDTYGTVFFDIPNLQNGSPDGIALSDSNGNVQFLSYEGVITAVNGVAMGMTSTDIGVSESSTTPEGQSLQLTGIGYEYDDFVWNTAATSSYNVVNTGQEFSAATASVKRNEIVGFKMYPNPVTDGIIRINTLNNASKTIQIFDVLGKQVLIRTLASEHLNVSRLNSGVYILRVSEQGKTATRKLVIK